MALPAIYLWNEIWVSPSGGGAHDGSSKLDAYDLAEFIASAHATGDSVNVSEDFGTSFAIPLVSPPFRIRGWTTGFVQLVDTIEDGDDIAEFTGTTGGASGHSYSGIKTTTGGFNHGGLNYVIFDKCLNDGALSIGLWGNNYCATINCRGKNSAFDNFAFDQGSSHFGSQAFFGGRDGFATAGGADGCSYFGVASIGNADSQLVLRDGGLVVMATLDGRGAVGSSGLDLGSDDGTIIASQITNCAAAFKNGTGKITASHVNFFGNTDNDPAAVARVLACENCTEDDPGYVDMSLTTPLYEVTTPSQLQVDVPTYGRVNIGAWQGGGGGGGGGFPATNRARRHGV